MLLVIHDPNGVIQATISGLKTLPPLSFKNLPTFALRKIWPYAALHL